MSSRLVWFNESREGIEPGIAGWTTISSAGVYIFLKNLPPLNFFWYFFMGLLAESEKITKFLDKKYEKLAFSCPIFPTDLQKLLKHINLCLNALLASLEK